MSRGENQPIPLVFIVLAAVILFFLFSPAWATWDVEQNTEVIGGDQAGSLGLGFGMGDVDINDCLASKSTLVNQWVVENSWCMANDLDARGNHDAAARVRCTTKTLQAVYPDPQECQAAVRALRLSDEAPVEEVADEDEDDQYREQAQADLAELESRMDRVESERQAAAQRAAAIRQAEQQKAQEVYDVYQETIK